MRDGAARLVVCDAGFDGVTGTACLAVTGAVGPCTELMRCPDHNVAEAHAVLLAMRVAEGVHMGGRPPALVFRTDSRVLLHIREGKARARGPIREPVAAILEYLVAYRQWSLQWTPRSQVGAAHALATARLARHRHDSRRAA